jgi:hypothetical protein
MQAAYVEFQLDSSTMNTREFYASRQGTHRYLTKEAVACAITYTEVLLRNKSDLWAPLDFAFDCTPAAPITVRTANTIYKAGDQSNIGLLRFGRQELIMPGSTFRFVAWGNLPPLWSGQVFLIGKKRAAARVTALFTAESEPDTKSEALGGVMPIQLPSFELGKVRAYRPIALTARYAIVQVPLGPDVSRVVVNGWAVPMIGALHE